jgi:hypothetical protein
MSPHPIEPDGLVVEDQNGVRLLAIPTQLLEILRFAAVLQYVHQGRVYRMRVDGFTDGRQGGQPLPHHSPADPDQAERWECPNPECSIFNGAEDRSCTMCYTPRPATA